MLYNYQFYIILSAETYFPQSKMRSYDGTLHDTSFPFSDSYTINRPGLFLAPFLPTFLIFLFPCLFFLSFSSSLSFFLFMILLFISRQNQKILLYFLNLAAELKKLFVFYRFMQKSLFFINPKYFIHFYQSLKYQSLIYLKCIKIF